HVRTAPAAVRRTRSEPGVDQPARDGQGRRQAHVAAAPGARRELLAREPAGVVELAVARRRLAARVVGEEAEHERRWERPRLRGEVAGRARLDAGLLAHLAQHRLLEALAGFDEAGESAVAPRRPGGLAAEQHLVAAR